MPRGLGGLEKSGIGDRIPARIGVPRSLLRRSEVVGQEAIEVVAAEMHVPVARQHLGQGAIGGDDRDVEGAAPEVVDQAQALAFAVAAVGQGADRLGGGECTIGPDFMEVGSFVGLAAVTGGEILIKNSAPQHLGMIRMTGMIALTRSSSAE